MRPFMLLMPMVLLILWTGAAADRRFEKTFAAPPGGTLLVATDLGSVRITGTDAEEVAMLAIVRGSPAEIERFTVTAVRTDQGVEVKGEREGRSWLWEDLEVEYTIRVPRAYDVRIGTAGGDIEIASLKGRSDGRTSGGNIGLRDIEGPVTMETSGGNVRAEAVRGSIQVETSGGNITVKDCRGPLDVNTSGGNIQIAGVEGKVRAETSGGDIAVRVKEQNSGVFVETSGGNIDIWLPPQAGATIDASTSGGDVTCGLPVTMSGKLSEHRIRGTVNGGGEQVRARTSGGDITIRPAP